MPHHIVTKQSGHCRLCFEMVNKDFIFVNFDLGFVFSLHGNHHPFQYHLVIYLIIVVPWHYVNIVFVTTDKVGMEWRQYLASVSSHPSVSSSRMSDHHLKSDHLIHFKPGIYTC